MKLNFYTIFLSIFCLGIAIGQSPRKVLVEHFTQASCGPCAYYNPLIAPILERNQSKVCKIAYQVSWPGVDPMNKDNASEVQTRVNYYEVQGVPDAFLNASSLGAPTNTITDAAIQSAALIPSPYKIEIQNKILADYNSMEISVTVTRTAAVSGTPLMRVAVCEKVIEWLAPPGTNGEKVFHHVMKKFLPNTTGTNISEIDAPGKSKTYTFVYKFDKVYNFRNLETVVFIQNDATKEVYQAENEYLTLTPNPGNDVSIKQSSASGVFGDTLICGTQTSPIVKVINTGNANITALEIAYSINGGPIQTHQWSGNIAFLEDKDITLPAIQFTPFKDANTMTLDIRKVNGQDDIEPGNNQSINSFVPTPSTTTNSTFELKPAAQPTQISFKIYDDQNVIIAEGGPFTDNLAKRVTLNLQKDKCYKITVINGTSSLNGTYKIFDDQNNQIFQQRVIGTGTFSRYFSTYTLTVGVDQEISNKFFEVYPNPVNDVLSLEIESAKSAASQIECRNINGVSVWEQSLKLNSGKTNLSIPTTNWNRGIYIISVTTPEGKQSRKIVVN
ncbi:MAG: Omp28-related outer membrane protein [Saprospiraceae bacterium]|nr:Omp28-related outer membrane protein [Saprospiraceae bacterium]